MLLLRVSCTVVQSSGNAEKTYNTREYIHKDEKKGERINSKSLERQVYAPRLEPTAPIRKIFFEDGAMA